MIRTPANRIFLAAQVSALLVLILFGAELLFSQQRDLQAGQEKTQRFNAMMAEHTARTFDAVDILLREISGELARQQSDWRHWGEDEGWNYLAQRHSRAMPQLRALLLYDEKGEQRHLSIPPGKYRRNISQQEDFLELSKDGLSSRAGPILEENAGQYAYTLGHRIKDRQGSFAGMVMATLEPVYLQEFCWPNRLSEDFEAVLVNRAGQIIAACRPSNQGAQSTLLGHISEDVLFNGQLRGHLTENGTRREAGFVIAQMAVPGFPELRMLTITPESSLLAAWHNRFLELSVLAAFIISIILIGGFLMRLQLKRVDNMTAQLEASHEQLEKRVSLATEQLASQRDNAELANVAKSRFLAAASHDLRQPMHALALFATDLQTQALSGNYRELPRLAEQIGSSTQLLGELLDSLLDISRLDVAGITPDIRSFPLQFLFERQLATHRRAASAKGIVLRFRASRHWLTSDPNLLERMLGNLVSNALRYTPQGGRVLIGARRRGDRVCIEVRDNGIGIAEKNQEAIFSEFYQVANAAREQHQGLGLGLSIVDRLARALHIPISLKSALNRGTLFSLSVQGATPERLEIVSEASGNTLPLLYFIGNSPALNEALRLAEDWGYPTGQQASSESPPGKLPYDTLVFCDQAMANDVRLHWAGSLNLIAFVKAESTAEELEGLPEEARPFRLPLRPARLRALLGQLQNTSSKSMP